MMRRSNGGNQARLSDDGMDAQLQPIKSSTEPVECLGMTFENDEARRAYFLERLKEKLSNTEFRNLEGFPTGKDEDILKLSNPPYYTACPNPFVEELLKRCIKPYNSSKPYCKEPFTADVKEGKNDPIYEVHSYHTKVPHKAIMRYILHYTDPDNIVFDGFCGSGMTGIAAKLCADKNEVESLGYKIKDDGIIFDEEGEPYSKLGTRYTLLNDLSPAATFISYNYSICLNIVDFSQEANRIFAKVEEECAWMYATRHVIDGKQQYCHENDDIDRPINGRINYVLWSDVFICPMCLKEIVYWEIAIDKSAGEVRKEFNCPHCKVSINKNELKRLCSNFYDINLGKTIKQAKQVPVLINYSVEECVGKKKCAKRYEKKPDDEDLALIKRIEEMNISNWYPTDELPEGDNTEQPKISHGFTHAHHFYTKRNLWILSSFLRKISEIHNATPKIASKLMFLLTSTHKWSTKMSRLNVKLFFHGGGGVIAPALSGTLYIPSLSVETNVLERFRIRLSNCQYFNKFQNDSSIVMTQSSTKLATIPQNSVDYIFIDPPFGANLMYSELNFLWEVWLRVFTDNKLEAIENRTQNKGLFEYHALIAQCFKEFFRVLKSGRWMTIEFHNSRNSVWAAIQDALFNAGFVIADVSILDKTKSSFKQITSTNAVKQDLIITAYKPDGSLEDRFKFEASNEQGVWDFARAHLEKLPCFVSNEGRSETIAERQNYLLFDRMVAFYLRRGVTVPLSSAEFYDGLAQRFPERDGMYFLSEQVAEYEKKKMKSNGPIQLQLLITNESSAIQWLKQQLSKKPQTLQEIHPNFMSELAGWSKHETLLELRELLEQNFIRYDGEGDVPGPIHSYLSTTYKELRNLTKTDPNLVAKATNRWYIPDPKRAGDLEKLREKALLKEFHLIAESKKRIKEFRIEAVRAGFKKCWDEGDHKTILEVAKKLPTSVVEEDSHLLMYTDLARMRQG